MPECHITTDCSDIEKTFPNTKDCFINIGATSNLSEINFRQFLQSELRYVIYIGGLENRNWKIFLQGVTLQIIISPRISAVGLAEALRQDV